MRQPISCFKCGHSWSFEPPLGRADECPQCHWDAHICMNCTFYDRGYHHDCREEQAEFVAVKDRSNFCDYFQALGARKNMPTDQDAHRSKLDQFFSSSKKLDEPDKPSKDSSLADELQKFLQQKR